MSRLYGDLVDTLVPSRVRSVLASDSTLAAMFGTSIFANTAGQLVGRAVRAPAIEVVPITLKQNGRPGDHIEGTYLLHIYAYLPAETPADNALTVLSAPTLAAGSAGALTGTCRYAVTGFTATAESFVSSPSASITVTAKRITVTVTTATFSAIGRRLWRTPLDGQRVYRYLATLYDNTTTTYLDNALDATLSDEIAPDVFLPQRISGAIKLALEAGQTLDSPGGERLAAPVFDVGDDTLTFSPSRNQWVLKVPVMHTVAFTRTGRASIEETY